MGAFQHKGRTLTRGIQKAYQLPQIAKGICIKAICSYFKTLTYKMLIMLLVYPIEPRYCTLDAIDKYFLFLYILYILPKIDVIDT